MDNIQELYAKYQGAIKTAKEAASEIIQILSDPDDVSCDDELNTLNESWGNAKADRSSIIDSISSQLPEDLLPPDVKLSAYMSAMNEFDERRKGTKHYEDILTRFVSLTSKDDTSRDSLLSIKEKADHSLHMLKQRGILQDDLISFVDQLGLFMQAFDAATEERKPLIRDLRAGGIFSADVLLGLSNDDYTIEDETLPPDDGLDSQQETSMDPHKELDSHNDSIDTVSDLIEVESKILDKKRPTPREHKDFMRGFNDQQSRKYFNSIMKLLAHHGVLTHNQLSMLLVFSPNALSNSLDNINSVIDYALARSYIAKYSYNDIDPKGIYCLTEYGYNSGKSLSGKHRLFAKKQLPKSYLDRLIATNQNKFLYITKIGEQLLRTGMANYSGGVATSVDWLGEEYVCAFAFLSDDKTSLLQIRQPALDFIDQPAQNIILLSDEDTLETLHDVVTDGKNIFAFENDQLFKWEDGKWIKDTSASSNYDSDNSIVMQEDDGEPEGMLTDSPSESIVSAQQGETSVGFNTTSDETLPHSEQNDRHDHACSDSQTATVEDLLESVDIPQAEHFDKLAQSLIENATYDSIADDIESAVLLLRTASISHPELNGLSMKVSIASNISFPIMPNEGVMDFWEVEYTGESLQRIFPDLTSGNESTDTEPLAIAAWCRALIRPSLKNDYTLKSSAEDVLKRYDDIFPSFSSLKPLFHKLCESYDPASESFTPSVIKMIGSGEEVDSHINRLQSEARELSKAPMFKEQLKGLPLMLKKCFGPDSDLNECLKIIMDDNRSEADIVDSVLQEYLSDDGDKISDDKISAAIDDRWAEVVSQLSSDGERTHKSFKHTARSKTHRAFSARLELLKAWLDTVELAKETSKGKLAQLRDKRDVLLHIIDEVDKDQPPVIHYFLGDIRRELSGSHLGRARYEGLLRSGVFPFYEDGTPVISEYLNGIRYYEPWRNALRHITSNVASIECAGKMILDRDSQTFDNYRQLAFIRIASGIDATIPPEDRNEAEKGAVDAERAFRSRIELASMNGQIEEIRKETFISVLDDMRDTFYTSGDLGCWRQLIVALDRQLDEESEDKREEMLSRLVGIQEDDVKKSIEDLIEENRIAVAEEYLNRYENGENSLAEELAAVLKEENGEGDVFLRFISDNAFMPLYDFCNKKRGKQLRQFGITKIRKLPGWSDRDLENAEKLLKNWPNRFDATKETEIETFFKLLGFQTKGAEKRLLDVKFQSTELYCVNVIPDRKDKRDYQHPISGFGTKMPSRLNVVVFYGNRGPDTIVKTMQELNFDMAVVLIDFPLDIVARRKIANVFRRSSGLNRYIIIDQTLALFLASRYRSGEERMPALLRCTLPYTHYQPFISGGGHTDDEMFFGRENELRKIMDPNGETIVYGGRQLGKTALLQRAESRFGDPTEKKYAVYCELSRHSGEETDAVERILEKIAEKPGIRMLESGSIHTIEGVCSALRKYFNSGEIGSMLLMLDEADRFLEHASHDGYRAIQPLISLKRETGNRFKFVLAGLHNVMRAKRATSDNGEFGQLGTPLCIKPLSGTDALRLIQRPLTYLGFRFAQTEDLETILTRCIYYPGILQLFGYKLAETLLGDDYLKLYDVNTCPPFRLNKELLGKIINSSAINDSVKEKFRLSLKLDPRYYMLARCVVYLRTSEQEGIAAGYSVQQISQVAKECNIHCLSGETSETTETLLDEMVDMGILTRIDVSSERKYRLRLSSSVSYISENPDDILDEIARANEVGK